MSQTVCPSCGASFMTPWPQCPICGATIPSSAVAPPDLPMSFGQEAPDGSLISSEPFVPPAYDSPIPEPPPEKPKAPGSAAPKNAPIPDFGFPGGSFGGFDPPAPAPEPSAPAPAPAAGGFDFDPSQFAGMDFTAPATESPSPTAPASSSPAYSSPGFSSPGFSPPSPPSDAGFGGAPSGFGQDDGAGIDPSSFKSFDFTNLDGSSMGGEAPKAAAPADAAPAPPPGLKGPLLKGPAVKGPALKGPPAFRGQAAPGGGPPGFSAPPAFRKQTGPAPADSSAALDDESLSALGGAPGTEATPRPSDAPSSFADLNTPGVRPQARRGPPPGAVRNPNATIDVSEATPLSDDKLSTAGLAPVHNDEKTLMEQALERHSAQREQQARTGLTTLLMITLMLLVFVAGAAFLVVQFSQPPLPEGSTPLLGTAAGTTPPVGTVVVGPGAGAGTGSVGTGAVATAGTGGAAGMANREVIDRCIDEIRNASPEVRESAGQALVALGAEAVPFVVPLLNDPKLETRRSAVETLRDIGPAAAEAAQPLLAAFNDGSPLLQASAAQALMKIRGPTVAAGLGESYAAASGSLTRRKLIMVVLDELGPEAEPAVPALVNALQDADSGVRDLALSALKKVGAPAVSAVAGSLRSTQPAARMAACQYMATMQSEALPAVPDLIAMLGDRANVAGRTADVGLYAMHALSQIGPGAVEPLLEVFKTSEIDEVRERAATAVGRIGPDALDPLIGLLNTGTLHEALGAVLALEEMGPRAKPALDALRAAAAKFPSLRINIEAAMRSIQK